MNIPYRINPFLVGNRHFTTHTVFQIRSLNDAENLKAPSYPLAVGLRYNSLAKKVGMKRDVPAVGITIAYKKRGRGEGRHTLKIKKSKIFFIQLGFEAKLRSLRVIEMLRQEDIPIHQSLSRDKLAGQLSLAESMKIPYAVIMGQKEAVEGTVIVRDMNTRSQDTVIVSALPGYLRKLKYK
jgi:histidyl-tRNA synthetase